MDRDASEVLAASARQTREASGLLAGRSVERDLVRRLATSRDARALVYFWGPPGSGKSALLRGLAADLVHAGTHAAEGSAGSVLGEGTGRIVLEPSSEGMPTVELLDLDDRRDLREPAPPFVLVVAGRHQPPLRWEIDPPFGATLHAIELQPLETVDAHEIVAAAGAPARHHEAIVALGRGHPLCLLLASEHARRHPGEELGHDGMPPALAVRLLEHVASELESPDRRAAVEACAVAGRTGQDLLAAALLPSDGFALFQWLRGCSLAECTPLGLAIREPFRSAVLAELRWRNPDTFVRLVRRIRRFYQERLRPGTDHDTRRLEAAYRFLATESTASGQGPAPPPVAFVPDHALTERDARVREPEPHELTVAVRDALRSFRNDAALATSPLLRTSLVSHLPSKPERVAELRRLLLRAAEPLARSARTEKLHRALQRTYFEPAATQEQAADLLGLPFGTYRRHLRAALEHVTATLAHALRRGAPPASPLSTEETR